jgi:methylphosphotriester-DNA--protein-cysteine methyltransferase
MDISAATTATTDTTDTAVGTQFEDALRQEVLLVPEDMEDIHIQASSVTADAATTDTATATTDDTPANNTRNAAAAAAVGKGKHWKRNLKKKQQIEQYATERTQEQRREQIRPGIDKLTELQRNVSYPAVRELYKVLNQYVKTGEDTKFKIPFPEFSRKIKGELSNAPYIPCWVKLEMD